MNTRRTRPATAADRDETLCTTDVAITFIFMGAVVGALVLIAAVLIFRTTMGTEALAPEPSAISSSSSSELSEEALHPPYLPYPIIQRLYQERIMQDYRNGRQQS